MDDSLLVQIAVRLLIAVYIGLGFWLTMRVVRRAGHAWWWALIPWAPSLFWVIPRIEIIGVLAAPVPLILLWVFAFAEWPSLIDTASMGRRSRGLTMAERDTQDDIDAYARPGQMGPPPGAQTQVLGRGLAGDQTALGAAPIASARPLQVNWLLAGFDNNGHTVRLEIAMDDLRQRPDGLVVGRHPQIASLIIADDSVSRRHAVIRNKGDRLTLTDLGSANGTSVNGDRLDPDRPVFLERGAEVEFGAVTLTLSSG